MTNPRNHRSERVFSFQGNSSGVEKCVFGDCEQEVGAGSDFALEAREEGNGDTVVVKKIVAKVERDEKEFF